VDEQVLTLISSLFDLANRALARTFVIEFEFVFSIFKPRQVAEVA
jgi:hypothetical protein